MNGRVIKAQSMTTENHRFVCHNNNVGTLLLRQSERIYDGQTNLVMFLPVLLINFSLILMKPTSFVIWEN